MAQSELGWWTLAQAGTEAGATLQGVNPVGAPGTTGTPSQPVGPNGGGGAPAGSPPSMLWMFLPVIGLMILMPYLSSRKEKKRQELLKAQVKKGERVQTYGGIIGTVVELGERDVVLRVEDGRIRFTREAIQAVLPRAGAEAVAEAKPEATAAV